MSSVMLRGWLCDGAARGMRRDDRRRRDLERVVERLVGDVRDVHHHAKAVHLADDVLAERREAVVRRLVGRRIGPVVVLEMRQRHIADAERGVRRAAAADRRRSCGRLPCPSAPRSCARPRRAGCRRRVVASTRSFGWAATASCTASICSSARLTAGGPVTSLGTQIEKNSASRPPSRMRGMSMLPFVVPLADVERLVEEAAAASCRRASR